MNLIRITNIAMKKLKKIGTPDILFYCKSGGCNGLEYVLKPIKDIPEKAEKQKLDNNTNLWVCNSSIFHLIDTKIDWVEDIMGNRFSFSNPNASGSCGCGKTFSV